MDSKHNVDSECMYVMVWCILYAAKISHLFRELVISIRGLFFWLLGTNVYFQVWIPPTFAKRLEQESRARGVRVLLYSLAISDFLSTSKDRDSRKDRIK